MTDLSALGFQLIKGFADGYALGAKRDELQSILGGFEPQQGDVFKDSNLGSILMNPAQRHAGVFAAILDHERLWGGLKAATACRELAFIPETSIHLNSYGDWHKDTRAQEVAKHYFHWTSFYQVFTVALYFQKNDPDTGGGLEVLPQSHRTQKTAHGSKGVAGTRLESDIGDAVIFDMRLDHKASWPSPGHPRAEKVALYFTVACPNSGGDLYMRFLKTRPDYVYLEHFKCPEVLQSVLKRHGVWLLAI